MTLSGSDFLADPVVFSLRPLSEADEEFSFLVYASTRAAEMLLVNWPEAQKQSFLRMQFTAQRQHYHLHYPQARWQVIEVGGQALGRLITTNLDEQLFMLMDIALFPEFCGRGIGKAILRNLIRAADQANQVICLHVEPNNPARRLYERLGFVLYRQDGFYLELRRQPGGSA